MTNAEIDEILGTYPDKVADALLDWRKAELEAKRTYAKEYLDTKAQAAGEKVTVGEIEAKVRAGSTHYKAVLEEITAESGYVRANERLMSAKKLASIRAAF